MLLDRAGPNFHSSPGITRCSLLSAQCSQLTVCSASVSVWLVSTSLPLKQRGGCTVQPPKFASHNPVQNGKRLSSVGVILLLHSPSTSHWGRVSCGLGKGPTALPLPLTVTVTVTVNSAVKHVDYKRERRGWRTRRRRRESSFNRPFLNLERDTVTEGPTTPPPPTGSLEEPWTRTGGERVECGSGSCLPPPRRRAPPPRPRR